MTHRDRYFALGTALSALFPLLLMVGQPIDEARATLGYALGWLLAAAVLVPSFLLMRSVMDTDNQLRFQQIFLGSMMGRMLVSILAIVGIAVLMVDPPLKAFLTVFFVSYMGLSGLEVALLTSRRMAARAKGEPA